MYLSKGINTDPIHLHTKDFPHNCKMVFTGKIHPETRAYIKHNKNTPVIDVMKETKVSREKIYRIKKEPLRTKAVVSKN